MPDPSMPAFATTEACRRRQPDRRRAANLLCPTRLACHLGLRDPRRQSGRRCADRLNRYVDWYESPVLAIALLTFALSCLDAFLTLNLLELGAIEINAVMASLIHMDTGTFVNVKIALTALCVIFLVIHHNFQIIGPLTVQHVLYGVLALYLMLVLYEAALWYAMTSVDLRTLYPIYDTVRQIRFSAL